MRVLLTTAAGLAMFLATTFPAQAHPHAWIDITIAVEFDDQGQVTGLRENWLFDEFYTVFATEGTDGDGDGAPDQDQLENLMRDNMRNLTEFDYFTTVEQAGTRLGFGTVTEMATQMNGLRLELTFTLPLANPVGPGASLVYSVYDPTFYIEVLHAQQSDAITLVGAPAQCLHWLIPPNPDANSVSLANALDKTQTAGDGLGIFFAERVEIQCD